MRLGERRAPHDALATLVECYGFLRDPQACDETKPGAGVRPWATALALELDGLVVLGGVVRTAHPDARI